MKPTRRSFTTLAAAAVASPAVFTGARAQAAVTLRLHHFLPPVSNAHRRLLQPWADQVSTLSGGRLAVRISPSMQLGGTPPQLFDQAKDGVVDIVWTLPGSTPGRFPSTEVFELPFLASRLGRNNGPAAQEYADAYLKDETKDVKLLSFWAHDHGLVHSKRKVTTLDDLKGMKLRFPTRLAGEALKAAGAAAIGMPVPQVPESIAQGAIEGAVVPWEVVPSIKLHELVNFHLEIPGTPTLYTASFFLAMNKAKFDGLPADLQKIIDDTTGLAFATAAGKMWDEAGKEVEDMVRKRGNTISVLAESEKTKWVTACEPITAAWIEQIKARNLDGAKLIAAAKALIAKHTLA